MTGTYSFCAVQECPVVYFEEQGSHRFTRDDLRVRVGVKESGDPIPLCYCFGFDESHMRDEITRTGKTTILSLRSSERNVCPSSFGSENSAIETGR